MKTMLSTLLKDKGSHVYAVAPSDTIFDSVSKMNDKKVGALLVLEGDKLVGIFTERDATKKVLLQHIDLSTPVSVVMTSKVLTVKPSTTVEAAMSIVTEKRFRHLPVVEDGKVLGLISIGDLTRWVVLSQEIELNHLIEYIGGNVK